MTSNLNHSGGFRVVDEPLYAYYPLVQGLLDYSVVSKGWVELVHPCSLPKLGPKDSASVKALQL